MCCGVALLFAGYCLWELCLFACLWLWLCGGYWLGVYALLIDFAVCELVCVVFWWVVYNVVASFGVLVVLV